MEERKHTGRECCGGKNGEWFGVGWRGAKVGGGFQIEMRGDKRET